MEPQKAIRSLREILDDLSNDGYFLTAELIEIKLYSKLIMEKVERTLG